MYLLKIMTNNTNTSKFSVSLVYQNSVESLLRVLIISAENEIEAFDKTVKYFENETQVNNLLKNI